MISKTKKKAVKKPAVKTVKKKPVKKGRLKPITSLFDLSMKMKDDDRYEKVLIKSYNYNDQHRAPTLLKAKRWLNEWVKGLQPNEGCGPMVTHFNKYLREFNERR